MNARAQASIVLAFGVVMVHLAWGHGLLRYVNPTSRPWVCAAGAVMVAVAGSVLLASRQDDVSRSSASSLSSWVLLAPLMVVVLVAPPALGSFTALRSRPVATDPHKADYPALPASGPSAGAAVELTTLDFVSRALTQHGDTLVGRRVQVTGFSLGPAPHGFVLSRLVITCCAADAAPVDVAVVTAGPVPARDAWVTVVGTFAGVEPGRRRTDSAIPRLRASSVIEVIEPVDPYEH